ncbi:MAG: hypothetical protein MJ218_02455 [Opitutales bacterium]|nr:hypothetical protein [Opitutales bacterium]
MSLVINHESTINFPTEAEAFKVFQLLEKNGFIQDLQRSPDDVVTFKTDDTFKEVSDLICNSEELKAFVNLDSFFNDRYKTTHTTKLYRPTVELFTREGTPEEKKAAGIDGVRVLTFDTLMNGIEFLYPSSTAKWIAMNADSKDAWDALSKAIKDYAANIQVLSGIEGENASVYYQPSEAFVAKYRKQFEKALLKLANHPIGRQTVLAILCINQEVLKDLPMILVICPRIHVEGHDDKYTMDSYNSSHVLTLSPDFVDFWPLLKHELGHLVLGLSGLDRSSGSGLDYEFIQSLLGNKNHSEFYNKCREIPGLVSEDGFVLLPQEIANELFRYIACDNRYWLRSAYSSLALKAHFSTEAEMIDIIGVKPHWMPGDHPNSMISCLVINRLSDFDFLEQVRWGHGNKKEFDYVIDDINEKLASKTLDEDERKLYENAKQIIDIFLTMNSWSTLQPDPEAFKRLCQLHERDVNTKYIDDRIDDTELNIESNVRRVPGWEPERI